MIEVVRYREELKADWDAFVKESKNGIFLFYRDYMEYHSDRFDDFSLMVYSKNKLLALLPANINNETLYSHQGLTYGGIILKPAVGSIEVLEYFKAIINFLSKNSILKIIYKAIPQIYSEVLCQEDLYALFRNGASIEACNNSSVVSLKHSIQYNRNRKRKIRDAQANKLAIIESEDLDAFWSIMEKNMDEKYSAKPVHTSSEMRYLKDLFPENIRLWLVLDDKEVVAGALIYLYKGVVKIQYAHANEEGKNKGGIDLLYDFLISKFNDTFNYIDFGPSNLDGGHYQYDGLVQQKEGFGAKSVANQVYSICLDNDDLRKA